jgi:hypothetical protein
MLCLTHKIRDTLWARTRRVNVFDDFCSFQECQNQLYTFRVNSLMNPGKATEIEEMFQTFVGE